MKYKLIPYKWKDTLPQRKFVDFSIHVGEWNNCVGDPTRQRVESSARTNHEDHIAGKGFSWMTHFFSAHKFIPMPQAMKIPDATAAVDKEWKKLETIPVWNLEQTG